MAVPSITVDPHVHSVASYDGRVPVEHLLKTAEDLPLDAIVITDHDCIEESIRAAELAPGYDLIGIPGVEVSTAAGHILAIGVTDMPAVGQPVQDTVDEIRALGGVAIIAHPFQLTRHGIKKRDIVDGDAIEVYNSWLITGFRNRRADTFAKTHGYTRVGGSDAHTAVTVGRTYTEVFFPDKTASDAITSTDVVEAIRNGQTAVTGQPSPVHRTVAHYCKTAGLKTGHMVRSRTPSLLGASQQLK